MMSSLPETGLIIIPYSDEPDRRNFSAEQLAKLSSIEAARKEKERYNKTLGRELEEERKESVTWCICGERKCESASHSWPANHPVVKPKTTRECFCCQEVAQIVELMKQLEHSLNDCVCQMADFEDKCLNAEILKLWAINYAIGANTLDADQVIQVGNKLDNRLLRHTAYRNFTAWIHMRLGTGVRKEIPFCVVLKIRSTFPDPDGDYVNFKDVF